MQCLPRITLSPSAVAVQQLRNFRLLPSLLSEASNGGGASAEARKTSDGGGIKPSYDMVIAGDGPVSTALACNIGCEPSLSHKRVLLLHPPGKGEKDTCGEVSVLSQSSVDLLKRIGAWPDMLTKSVVKPFRSIHIWDGCSDAYVVFNRSDLSQEKQDDNDLVVPGLHGDDQSEAPESPSDDSIGYIVSNQLLMRSLLENLASYDNVQLETETKAKVIRKVDNVSNSLVQIMLDNGRNVSTNLLVGSDGPNSRVRQLCGFYNVGWSHDQWAFTAAVEVKEAGRNSTVWQRLLPSGPITMLPLSETTSALLWCTSQDHAQSLVSMTDPAAVVDAVNAAFFDTLPQNDFVASVSDALRDTVRIFSSETPPPHQLPPLATVLEESSKAATPLALAHTPNYVKDRIVLIGDASHQMHPLTGLGLNLGLGDVTALTERLLQANSRGDDWGSLEHLLQYETERQQSNVPTMAAAEGLHWLYSSSITPFVIMRSIGFNLTNAYPPVKDYIVRNTW